MIMGLYGSLTNRHPLVQTAAITAFMSEINKNLMFSKKLWNYIRTANLVWLKIGPWFLTNNPPLFLCLTHLLSTALRATLHPTDEDGAHIVTSENLNAHSIRAGWELN
jgi:hypothetical protein